MPGDLPVAAATGVDQILTDLFVVLLAAKLGDELFKRLGQPALIGEILAGVAIGPSVLGIVDPGEVLEVFAELGVVFLLFWVGLETRISEMREVGADALAVGIAGVVLPFAGGVGLGFAIGESTATSVFLGAALAATSVGITSAVLIELGLIRSAAARTVLGAAIVDDILALILVAVATGIAAEGGIDPTELLVVCGLAVAFVGFFALGGTALVARRPQILHEPRFSDSPLLPAVILCLGLAAFAAQIGLAAIIGAFLAGLMVAETKEQHPIEDEIAPLYAFFPPSSSPSSGSSSIWTRSRTPAPWPCWPRLPWSRSSPSSPERRSAPAACSPATAASSRSGWSPVGRSGSSSPASAPPPESSTPSSSPLLSACRS